MLKIARSRFVLDGKLLRNSNRYLTQNVIVQKEVQEAIHKKKPVLALESTIITHGMPYPNNLRTALEVEEIVRQYDVTPATVGLIDGKIHVGMNNTELEFLACCKESVKLSKRDLPVALLNKQTGGTTVSATMWIANKCNINLFVTGGVGGVHQNGEFTMDVSADLKELGQTPVTVVSAGVKSILDIGRTLEYMETEGVTVATFGNHTNFPAFYTSNSGFNSHANVPTVHDAAVLMYEHSKLGLQNGILIAVPIPNDHAASGIEIEVAIKTALKECSTMGIAGKEITPYVLQRVNELTDGKSLQSNIALIKNNAKIGAQIAKEYSILQHNIDNKYIFSTQAVKTASNRPVVIGGCNVDIISKCTSEILPNGPSNPAIITQSFGGVGKNLAEALWILGNKPFMISVVGDDYNGNAMMGHLNKMNFDGILKLPNHRTGVYNALINSNGELSIGSEDSQIHDKITEEIVLKHEDIIKNAPIVCVDANIPVSTMTLVCQLCTRHSIPLLFEPTGDLKADVGFRGSKNFTNAVTYCTPNIDELKVIHAYLSGSKQDAQMDFSLEKIAKLCLPLLDFTKYVLVTLGSHGVLCAYRENDIENFVYYSLTPSPDFAWLKQPIVNVSGSGDSFAGGIAHGIACGHSLEKSIKIGIAFSQMSLRCSEAISKEFSSFDFESLTSELWSGKDVHF